MPAGAFAIDPDTGVITVASSEPLKSWALDHSFDGDDDVVVLPHEAGFELDQGTVSLSFTADQVSGTQGLLSKDSLDFDDGGHLSIWLEGDQVVARLQSDSGQLQLVRRRRRGHRWGEDRGCGQFRRSGLLSLRWR